MRLMGKYLLAGIGLAALGFAGVVLHPWVLHYRMAHAVAACEAENNQKLTEKLIRSGTSEDTFRFLLFGQVDCKLIYQRYKRTGAFEANGDFKFYQTDHS